MGVNAQMKFQEKVEVTTKRVACDGGVLGHPKVYLEMGNMSEVTCPYCSFRYVFVEPDSVSKEI